MSVFECEVLRASTTLTVLRVLTEPRPVKEYMLEDVESFATEAATACFATHDTDKSGGISITELRSSLVHGDQGFNMKKCPILLRPKNSGLKTQRPATTVFYTFDKPSTLFAECAFHVKEEPTQHMVKEQAFVVEMLGSDS